MGHIVGQLLGMVASGFVLFKFRPRAVSVQVWNVLGGLCMVVGLFINSQTACERAPWIRPGGTLSAKIVGSKFREYFTVLFGNLSYFHWIC